MRLCGTSWRRRPEGAGALAALALLLAATGCVTRGRYDEAVAQRDALAQEKTKLEASTQSLGSERAQLLDEMEDLRQQKQKLDADVRRLGKREAELSEQLAAREAALAQSSAEVERLHSTYEGLVSDLEAEVATGQIQIQQLRDGLQLNLAQEVLFSSGSAEVNASGRAVLARVAERLKELPQRVVVQGYTDNVPISSKLYPTNWELAAARASRVVRLLQEHGVDPGRMSAVSFGEWKPLAPNDTPEGRARNRRIEITLLPVSGPAETPPEGEASSAKAP